MLAYVLAVVVVLVAALLGFGLAALMNLHGMWYWGFVVALLLLGIGAAITILVFHYRARKERELEGDAAGAGDSSDLDLLLNDANRKLRSSQQGAKALDSLPLIYILGDTGAAKTTTVMQSGLDPELLVGSASTATEQTPTQVLNLWYSRQAALLEVGAAVRANNALFARLVHRTRAKAYRSAFGTGAAPRAVIVCLSMDQLLAADGGSSLMASARSTGSHLRELSRLLGMPIPVYVMITKLDRIAHFDKYARNLTEEEVRQVLGATLPRSDATVGTYADKAAKSLAKVIDGIVYQLGEFRVEILDRENDPRNTSGAYEFPRELGKMRKGLNQYLVELCKPSQLSANPYLRGVYFTGIRARVVERAAVAPLAAERPVEQDPGATQFLKISMGQAGYGSRAAAPPVMVQSRVPQWTFLPRLIPEVIFGDKSALSASRQTAPARLFRRILFGTLAFLFALYCFCLVVSYINNSRLERRIARAAHALPVVDAMSISPPGLSDLRALEDLRQTIVELDGYQKNGAPLRFGVGLYQGEKLDREARSIYFDRFRPRLLNPAQNNMVNFMHGLPDAPLESAANDSNVYKAAYNPLKAYLITTKNPEKSQTAFLTPVFLQYWIGGGRVDDEQQQLAQKQIDFYGNELLRTPPPYSISPDTATVEHTRTYLSKLGASTRIYQAMLDDADKASTQIDFKKLYPGAANYVVDGHLVRGAFTRDGFTRMQDNLKHPERFANGEPWVLGDQHPVSATSASAGMDFASQYSGDYLKEWHEFLAGAHVVNCGSLPDASSRLNILALSSSPLLELFFTISHNTAVSDPQIKSTFQPAQVLVDPNATDRLIGVGNNKPYIDALLALALAIDQADKAPNITTDSTAFAPISTQIGAANAAAQQTAQAFNMDPKTHTGDMLLALMQDPVKCVARFEPSPGAAGNGGGQKMCSAINPLLNKFPFSSNSNAAPASLQEVDSAFAPETGALATAYNTVLNKILAPSGTHYVAAPTAPGRVNPKFINYFERAEHISTALYSGGAKSPTLAFTLRFIPGNGVKSASLAIDGQRVPAGSSSQSYTWTASSAQKVSLIYDDTEAFSDQGTWSLFQMVRNAQIARTGGGFKLDYPIDLTVAGHKVNGTGAAAKTVTFELSGPGAEFLTGDGFTGLNCVQPVMFK